MVPELPIETSMLKYLRIQNIILIESAEIEFVKGFNVISGETGAGKSAVMGALNLIAGERADLGMIRHEAEKGIVEAVFDIKFTPQISSVLEQGGIDFLENEELYIRREIISSGKTRAFINNQLVQLSLLRSVTGHLMNIVGQHANHHLFSLEHHREVLDLFAGIEKEVATFSMNWHQEIALQSRLEGLISGEAKRLREIEVCQRVLDELADASLKEGEEESLFNEYTFLSHTEETEAKIGGILDMLNGEKSNVLALLSRHKNQLDTLASRDVSLKEIAQSYEHSLLELREISHALRLYHSRLENRPERVAEINERLALINQLKKRYGSSIKEIQAFKEETKKNLNELENADLQIEELREKLDTCRKKNDQLALWIRQMRQNEAQKLADALKKELVSLNMPEVDFHIEVTGQRRGQTGDDHVEFFLLPNKGEQRVAVRHCASGGELSRLLLSLETILSGRGQIPILIFDEIDANIGGDTAKIVGKKLDTIGKHQQVICVTHFPQVAREAGHHLHVSKKVVEERTVTLIEALNASKRDKELARMSGN